MTNEVRSVRDRLFDRAGGLGISLAPTELGLLEEYLLLLARWNRTINLTSLPLAGFPDATLDRLVMEPVVAAAHVGSAPASWIDLGSGGGSPAIPLKIVRPALRLIMVESRERRGSFLREAVRALRLKNAEVLTQRLQDPWPSERPPVDVVTVRGLRIARDLLAVSSSFLKPGGRLFLFTNSSSTYKAAEGFRHVTDIPLPGLGAALRILQKIAV